MFTRYDYKAGAIAVNVVNDIVALLTGTSDKTLLSVDCVQASTVIINDGVTRPAGWSLWDAAAGVRSVGVRALNYDGSTYKYVVVSHNNTTTLFVKLYESWNATTHVGVNLAVGSDITGTTVNLALGGTLFISASARIITTLGVISGVYDATPNSIIEHSRDEPWDTPALNIPPTAYFSTSTSNIFSTFGNNGGSNAAAKPRVRNAGADTVGAGAFAMGMLPYASYNGSNANAIHNTSPYTKVRDSLYNAVHAFCPITLSQAAAVGGEAQVFGKVFDMFVTTKSYGTSGDEVIFNGNSYFIMAASTSGVRLALPKY